MRRKDRRFDMNCKPCGIGKKGSKPKDQWTFGNETFLDLGMFGNRKLIKKVEELDTCFLKQNILKSVQFEIRNQKSLMNAYHFAIRIRLFFIFFLESKISDD